MSAKFLPGVTVGSPDLTTKSMPKNEKTLEQLTTANPVPRAMRFEKISVSTRESNQRGARDAWLTASDLVDYLPA
jgi:hypothetical protein